MVSYSLVRGVGSTAIHRDLAGRLLRSLLLKLDVYRSSRMSDTGTLLPYGEGRLQAC